MKRESLGKHQNKLLSVLGIYKEHVNPNPWDYYNGLLKFSQAQWGGEEILSKLMYLSLKNFCSDERSNIFLSIIFLTAFITYFIKGLDTI